MTSFIIEDRDAGCSVWVGLRGSCNIMFLQYIVMAAEDTGKAKLDNLKVLIEDYWKRKKPELVISVLGGLKNAADSDLKRVHNLLQSDLLDLAMASTHGKQMFIIVKAALLSVLSSMSRKNALASFHHFFTQYWHPHQSQWFLLRFLWSNLVCTTDYRDIAFLNQTSVFSYIKKTHYEK
mgnify:CR=1 FL=1